MAGPWEKYQTPDVGGVVAPPVNTGESWDKLAPQVTRNLARDLSITPMKAAAIVGQLGYESDGLQAINERNPVVPGSRGGFGWAQWTGPRRRAFEDWSAQHNLSVDSPDANYGFLLHELQDTGEGAVLGRIRSAPDAKTAGQIFTDRYLRPGVLARKQRDSWTDKALDVVMPKAQAGTLTDATGPWTKYGPAAQSVDVGEPAASKPWEQYAPARSSGSMDPGMIGSEAVDEALANRMNAEAAQPPSAKRTNQDPGLASDAGNLLKMGANMAAQDLRELTQRAFGKGVVDKIDAIDRWASGKSSDQLLREDTAQAHANLTPQTQAASDKKWWDSGKGTLGDAWSDPRSYMSGLLQSVPEQVPLMVGPMMLAKWVYAGRVAAGVAKDVAAKTAAKVATYAGGFIEGLFGGAQSSREVRDDILKMTPAQMKDSQALKALMDQGMTFDQARANLADNAATQAFVMAGVTTGVFGGMGDRVLADAFTKGLGKSIVGRTVKGSLAEGIAEELPQSYTQQVSQNIAERKANPSIGITDDALNQGLGGLAIGAAQGGAMAGAFGHSVKPGDSESLDNLYTDVAAKRAAEEDGDQAGPGGGAPPALPAPKVFVDSQGNARRSGQARPVPDETQQGAEHHPGADTSKVEPAAVPALPAPSISVDSAGTARTAEQRTADADALARLDAWAKENGYTKDVQAAGKHHPGRPQPVVDTPVDEAAHAAQTSPLDGGAIEPTDGQKEAGNYKLGHTKVGGLDISIENPEGSERHGTDSNGKPWTTRMAAHYGYVRRSEGADGDQVDVFVKPGTAEDYAGQVFVVDQVDPKTGRFDEHKAMIGYDSQNAAEKAYRANYARGWKGMGSITPMDMPAFKEWLKGDTTKPAAETAPQTVPGRVPSADLSRQNRDRSRPASIEQMNRIANAPDYDRLGFGRSPNEAAPMVSVAGDTGRIPESDMGRSDRVTLGDGTKVPVRYAVIEASDAMASHAADGTENAAYFGAPKAGDIRALNNGRTAALQEAYRRGTAGKYRQAMIEDAQAHGVSPEAIRAKRAPVLVRVYGDRENERSNIGALSNPKSNLGMSATEQAANDARAVPVDLLDLGEGTAFDSASNRRFLDAFARRVQRQGEDAAQIRDGQGNYSRQFMDRARAAVFHRAYGDDALTAMASESADPDVRNILNALTAAAPDFAGMDAGPLDIRPQLAEAVHQIRDARSRGLNVEQFLAQQDMFGREPVVDRMVDLLWSQIRSPKKMTEALREMALFAQNEQARAGNQDMFGGDGATVDDVITRGENLIRSRYGREQAADQTDLFGVGRSEGSGRADPSGARGRRQGEEQRAAADHDQVQEPASEAARGQSGRVEEPDGTQDLFGQGFELEPDISTAAGRAQPRRAGSMAPDSRSGAIRLPSLRSRAAAVLVEPEGGKFAVQVEAKRTLDLRVQDGRITSAGDVASAMSGIRKQPQENLMMLLTDEDGRPISVLRHSLGRRSETIVESGIIIGHAARVPKARNMWLVHNHPSGLSTLSDADLQMSRAVARLLDRTEIEYKGLMAVGRDTFSNVGADGRIEDGKVAPILRPRKIPVVERVFVRRGTLDDRAVTPQEIPRVAQKIAGNKDGVLLLDAQLVPSAFLPMTAQEMGQLRGTGGFEKLMAGVEKSNASAAITVVKSPEPDSVASARNLNTALEDAGIRALDILAGGLSVARNLGDIRRTDRRQFESRQPRPSAGVSDSGPVSQTSTLEFKRWFGDWEALRAQTRLDAMNPIKVRVPAEWRGLPLAGLREKVRLALNDLMETGEPLHHPELGRVDVHRRGVKKALHSSPDPAKLYLLGDLRKAFESSIFASAQRARGDAPNVQAYEKLLARVDIGGADLVAAFVVRRQSDGRQFYNAVTLEDKEKPQRDYPRDTLARSEERAQTAITGVQDFIRHPLVRVNPAIVSRVVDADGRPLVVYHGTDQSFDVFEGASWFTPTSADASQHSNTQTPGADHAPNLMPVYLNIRKPKVIDTYATRADIEAARSSGKYDGVIVRGVGGGPVDNYVTFRPEQVKSAIGNRGTFDASSPSVLESSARDGDQEMNAGGRPTGIKRADANIFAKAFMAKLPGAGRLKVSVVQSVRDIPEGARPSEMAEGVYYPADEGGRIYLVADNLPTTDRLYQVLAHEVVGHFGVEALLGDRFDGVLSDVQRLARVPHGERATGREKPGDANYATMEAVGMRYPDYGAKARAREVLARMAETNSRKYFLQGLYMKMRAALRSMGFNLKLTTADLRQMVIDAGRFLRQTPADQAFSGMRAAAASMAASESARPGQTGNHGIFDPASQNIAESKRDGAQPVRATTLSGDEVGGEATSSAALRMLARDWANTNLKGKTFQNAETGWKITVSGRGIKESLSRSARREKVQSMAGIPQLIENAILGSTAENHNKARDPFTERVHTFFAPLDIGSDRYVARLVVKENANGRFFYDHDLSGVMKAKRPDDSSAVSTPATKAGADRMNPERTMTIDEIRSVVNAEGRSGWEFDGDQQDGPEAPPDAELFNGPRESRAAGAAPGAPRHPGLSTPKAEHALRDKMLEQSGVFAGRDTIKDRFDRLRENAAAKTVQGVFDHFLSLKSLNPTAYMQARLSKGTDGAAEYLVRHGAVTLSDGALDGAGGKGLGQILAGLKGEHDHFMAWIAGNRAERLMAEGKERLLTPAIIERFKNLDKGTMADGRKRREVYAQALKDLNVLQKSVLDVAEEAGLIDGATRHLWEHEFYVPFYRVMEDDDTGIMGPGQIGGLVGQYAFKRLKGGEERLGDLTANTMANWSHLLSASMKNLAAQGAIQSAVDAGIATEISSAQKGSVRVMVNGKEKHYMVDDPLVLESLTALHYAGFNGPIMKAMGKMKHALTMGVTLSPTFRVRNLLRDTLQTLAIDSDVGVNPLANIVDGWKSTAAESDTMQKLLAGGGAVRFGSFNDGQARNVKRLVAELGVDPSQVIVSLHQLANLGRKAFDAYQELGDRGETVNRAAIYNAAIKHGKSHLEASYLARDLMDFTNTGSWASVRFLTQIVPFMNARLQGAYRLGRSAKGDFARFAAVTGTMALASAALFLAMKDDEDYKELPDWARNTYWAFKFPFGEKMYFIPKPFEVGALATVVERGTELAFGGDDFRVRDFGRAMAGVLGDQLAMDPTPQLFKPAMEASFNYDTFRGRNIDSEAQSHLPPGERFTPSTSAGAVLAGRLLDVSPQRIEHLASGYFGWAGVQAMNVADLMLRGMMGLPENPRKDLGRIDNWFIVGDFVKDPNARSSKYVQRFYDMQRDVTQMYAAYNQARAVGDVDRVRELAKSDEAKLYDLTKQAGAQMQALTTAIRKLERDPKLTMDQKRGQLDKLYEQRNLTAAIADERARAVR